MSNKLSPEILESIVTSILKRASLYNQVGRSEYTIHIPTKDAVMMEIKQVVKQLNTEGVPATIVHLLEDKITILITLPLKRSF